MRRKIASTLCALGTTLSLCAQDLSTIELTNKEDSVAYANTYINFDKYQSEHPEDYNSIIEHSDIFVYTIKTTYNGIIQGHSEKSIKEKIAQKSTSLETKEVIESAMLMGAMASGKNHKGAVFLRSLCDRVGGDTTLGWKKEDMVKYLSMVAKQKSDEEGKSKAAKEEFWNTLIKKEGYTELTTKDEGVASDLDYEGRGVLIKTDKKGKGDKIVLKDKATIAFSMLLLDGTPVCKGNAVEVVPDNVINGLCAALLNLRAGAKATIYIPEGLGYRDDIIFADPLKAEKKLVVNKALKMEVEVLQVNAK